MEHECAYCGRALEEGDWVYCDDCKVHHEVCQPCSQGSERETPAELAA